MLLAARLEAEDDGLEMPMAQSARWTTDQPVDLVRRLA
jgi:hypothetical protein